MNRRYFMENDYIVEGRNAVMEVLKSGREVNKLVIQKGERIGSIIQIIQLAKDKKIVITEAEKCKLDKISMTGHHQGVIIYTSPKEYCEIEDIIQIAKEKEEDPFIVILDEIEDPYNLGSIIRTCEVAGVHGLIIPKRRSALISETVEKVSVGATNYLPIARVNNLAQTIDALKKMNIWVVGTDIAAPKIHSDTDLSGSIALIIGNEGKGMGRLVKEKCDFLIKIPMKGKVSSLNAGVSAGICIYEIVRQRGNIKI